MKNIKKTNRKIEVLLWSIAFPGFGQLLNKRYFKGFILVALEFLINVKGKINVVIVSSFVGEINKSIEQADFQWLMFYPCIYLYAIWDAYRDAGGGIEPFSYLPFVCSAYLGTVGVIYSSRMMIMKHLLGPIFSGITFMVLGFFIGWIIKKIIIRTVMK